MSLLDFFRRLLRHIATMLLFPSAFKAVVVSPETSQTDSTIPQTTRKMTSLEALKNEITSLFRAPCTVGRMLSMSSALRVQYKAKLQESEACMLPSFCHTLPTGKEQGTYIALDVGGSTFRVALVDLLGRCQDGPSMVIKHMTSSKIDESIRRSPSMQFFDWMASRIEAMLQHDEKLSSSGEAIPIGLAWSFPVEQVSHRGGKIQGMGKGFISDQDTVGKDLGGLLEAACSRRNLNVRVDAIVNDSSAALLSQAYIDPATSMCLILGTGTNAAAFLPVSAMGKSKFGVRDPAWFKQAKRVITNTELSMFGKSILPETRWDEILNRQHQKPDFQPLEYMVSGRYLGEILRLIIVEGVQTGELFQGNLPNTLMEPYSLDTQLLARLEEDRSPQWVDSATIIQQTCQLQDLPSEREMSFLCAAAQSISYRASAYISVAMHALCTLERDSDFNPVSTQSDLKTSVACNGSVILNYPGFKDRCEGFLSEIIAEASSGYPSATSEKIILVPTDEAAVLGAAVAVALAVDS